MFSFSIPISIFISIHVYIHLLSNYIYTEETLFFEIISKSPQKFTKEFDFTFEMKIFVFLSEIPFYFSKINQS